MNMRLMFTIIAEGPDMETISEISSMTSSIKEKSVYAVELSERKSCRKPIVSILISLTFLFQMKNKNLTPNSSISHSFCE